MMCRFLPCADVAPLPSAANPSEIAGHKGITHARGNSKCILIHEKIFSVDAVIQRVNSWSHVGFNLKPHTNPMQLHPTLPQPCQHPGLSRPAPRDTRWTFIRSVLEISIVLWSVLLCMFISEQNWVE